jgi:hypothetical protein
MSHGQKVYPIARGKPALRCRPHACRAAGSAGDRAYLPCLDTSGGECVQNLLACRGLNHQRGAHALVENAQELVVRQPGCLFGMRFMRGSDRLWENNLGGVQQGQFL